MSRAAVRRLLAAALWWLLPGCLPSLAVAAPPPGCGRAASVQVQVLGSGGPELVGGRAGSGYLLWLDGRARLLVDAGGGVALRFGESGARLEDLDAILLTQLHADHSADLPALVMASSFGERTRELPLYGPVGNRYLPSTVAFARALFDNTRGAYRDLGSFLSPIGRDRYKLKPHDVRQPPNRRLGTGREPHVPLPVFTNERMRVTATRGVHGNTPALAYRIETGGKTIVFTGDFGGEDAGLALLARAADLLVAHHAIPETTEEALLKRHMPPSAIGRLAQAAGVRQLVLSHRTTHTLGQEERSLAAIRRHYVGPVTFADDLACFTP